MLNKAIIEVGAFDGVDGLALAYKNPKLNIYSFEANPKQIKIIKRNKKILELRKGVKLNNYFIQNLAIDLKNTKKLFYIAKNPRASSLNKVKNNLEKYWPGWKKIHFDQIKKINVRCMTLSSFCKKMKIDQIEYLHIDAQGSDLNVLKSLKKYIDIVQSGVIETAKSNSTSIYKQNHTLKEIKKFFKKKFYIKKIEKNTKLDNEYNVYFDKNLNSKLNYVNYNTRYYNRIFNHKYTLKDSLFDFCEWCLNQIFKRY